MRQNTIGTKRRGPSPGWSEAWSRSRLAEAASSSSAPSSGLALRHSPVITQINHVNDSIHHQNVVTTKPADIYRTQAMKTITPMKKNDAVTDKPGGVASYISIPRKLYTYVPVWTKQNKTNHNKTEQNNFSTLNPVVPVSIANLDKGQSIYNLSCN